METAGTSAQTSQPPPLRKLTGAVKDRIALFGVKPVPGTPPKLPTAPTATISSVKAAIIALRGSSFKGRPVKVRMAW